MTPEAFTSAASVSHETMARLERYAALLVKWNRATGLVGKSTLDDLWRRHMLDSAQLFPLIPVGASNLVDLGSGAGFPGMVLAIMGARGVHLIESSRRKCAFLEEVARAVGADVTIHDARIGEIDPFGASVITARALAPLDELLDIASPFVTKHSILLFLKGRTVKEELTRAQKAWTMRVTEIPSQTDSDGVILSLETITRALHTPQESPATPHPRPRQPEGRRR